MVKLYLGTVLVNRTGHEFKVINAWRNNGTVTLDDGRRLLRRSWGDLQRQIANGKLKVRNVEGGTSDHEDAKRPG